MRLRQLQLDHFRNHASTSLVCAEERNVFLGNNGEGKTNILEAISYLCLTKSFYASTDATAVELGHSSFSVTGTLVSDIDVDYHVHVSYENDTRDKEITINKGLVENKSSVIGMFPVVVLSPENGALTSGAPAERRRFVDIVVSQSNKSYLEDLMEYRRILRQRNRILADARMNQRLDQDLLEPWNENLVRHGAQISHRRAQFVQEFAPHLAAAFEKIAPGEHPSLRYESSIAAEVTATLGERETVFREALRRQEPEERKFGTSLFGPHKDELRLEINGLDLKSFASQGQHKTYLVALKIAEFFYLRQRCRETPMLLLDDVFSELDDLRSASLLALTGELGQTFITATDGRRFSTVEKQRGTTTFHVKEGRVSHEEPAAIAQ